MTSAPEVRPPVTAPSHRRTMDALCEVAREATGAASALVFSFTPSVRYEGGSGAGPAQLEAAMEQLGQMRVRAELSAARAVSIGGSLAHPFAGGALVLDGARRNCVGPLLELAERCLALERRASELSARERITRRTVASSRERLSRLEAQLAYVRHELKSPLVAVKGYVEMMARGMAGPLTPVMKRYLERIAAGVERQRELIERWLHLPERLPARPLLASDGPAAIACPRDEADWLWRTVRRVARRSRGDVSVRRARDGWAIEVPAGARERELLTLRALAARLGGRMEAGDALVVVLPEDPVGARPIHDR